MNDMSGPIRRNSLHAQIVEHLREMIHAGDLAPNEKLNERALCEQFGVSRTPLREAFKVLCAERLIRITPHYGASVTELTVADLEEVFPIIGALEGLAGELACTFMTDDEIAAVERMHGELVRHHAARDRARYFACNEAIHAAILEAARNPTLAETLRGLSGRVRRARYRANLSEDRWHRAVAEHEEILSRLKARDGKGLAGVLRTHLANKLATVRAALRDTESPARMTR